jgi:SAM-dependent methyltransferase
MPASPRIEPKAEHVVCPICGEDRPAPYRSSMYRIEQMLFDLVRCPCGMVYVNPRPDAETIERMYGDVEYYDEGYTCGVETEGYFDRRDEYLAEHDASIALLERESGLRSGELVELGAAGGFLLEAARRRGWSVHGVEISPPAATYAREEMGLDVFQGELADAPYESGSFDVAIAENVVEHTTRPDQVVARLGELLKPGGYLVVVVPGYVNSFFFRSLSWVQSVVPRRLLGERLLRILKFDPEFESGGSGYPYHILEFDRRSVTRLVREAGLEIVSSTGSLPLPAHLAEGRSSNIRDHALRLVFRVMDGVMRAGLLPGARLRVLARAPR